jgi:hypothetical protein
MANLGNVSVLNINGNELNIKDSSLTEIVNEIIEAIGQNNEDISEHINDLNDKAFDALIKIGGSSQQSLDNIQDGLYKVQYLTTYTINEHDEDAVINTKIVIQDDHTQLMIDSDGITKRTQTNNVWSNWSSLINLSLSSNYSMSSDTNDDLELEGGDTFEEAFSKIEKRIEDNELIAAAALTDLDTRINGISIPVIPVTSVNGQTGAVTVDVPVTSVNGATGDVVINLALATGYAMATAINDDLFLEGGDTYEEAFSKLEKSLNDNEEIVTTALIDLDDRVSVVEDKTSDLGIIANVTGYGNAVTGITASGMSLTITKGASYITTHQNIKTLNNVSLKGTGNINVVNSVNGMTGAVLIPISATVVANDTNPVSGGAVYTEISTLIGGAPDALNTLGEIATALNNDADLASTLTNQITSRMPKVTGATAGNFASLAADGTLINSGHSHNDYVTSVNGQTGTVNIGTLPAVTAADNGKILMVVNGQWEAVSPSILYSGTGIPNNANGNNGDIYIQTE